MTKTRDPLGFTVPAKVSKKQQSRVRVTTCCLTPQNQLRLCFGKLCYVIF
jgi:hypothetical protein